LKKLPNSHQNAAHKIQCRNKDTQKAQVLLVYPNVSSQERYNKDINAIGGHQLPLGIYYLAAYLRKFGYAVTVVDAEAFNVSDEEICKLLTTEIKIIGISSTTVAFRKARKLAEHIKSKFPHKSVVIGGPHMTAMPKQTIATKAFDFGIIQEGEASFLQLVEHILNGKHDLKDIPNLFYLEKEEIKSNLQRFMISNLDTLPFPARDLTPDLTIYKPPVGAYLQEPVASVITSRGCPYSCIFCDNNTFGRTIRYFSAEYVAKEIQELVTNYEVKEISFLDDTFVVDKKRLKKIFTLLARQNIKISWSCMTRVNNLDYETLKFMKDNGCWQIRVGIESGNQEVIDFIKKGITLEQVKTAVGCCRKLNIMVTGFFIIGHHTDTPQTIEQTIKFALSIPLTDVVVTINTPIPGTESYEKAQNYGTYKEEDWSALNYWTPVFVPHGLTRDFMLKKQAEFYKCFYLRPRVLILQMKKIRSFKTIKVFLKSALMGLNFIKNKKMSQEVNGAPAR